MPRAPGGRPTISPASEHLLTITLGLMILLTANHFDLSIASMTTFSSMTIAVLNVNHEVPIGWAIAAALASGLAVGFVKGYFIRALKRPSGHDGVESVFKPTATRAGARESCADFRAGVRNFNLKPE